MNDGTNQLRRPDGKFGPAIAPKASADAVNAAADASETDTTLAGIDRTIGRVFPDTSLMSYRTYIRDDGITVIDVSADEGETDSLASIAGSYGDDEVLVTQRTPGSPEQASYMTGEQAAGFISDHPVDTTVTFEARDAGDVDRVAAGIHDSWADERADHAAYSTLVGETVTVNVDYMDFDTDVGEGEQTAWVTDVFYDDGVVRVEIELDDGTIGDTHAQGDGTLILDDAQRSQVRDTRRKTVLGEQQSTYTEHVADAKNTQARLVNVARNTRLDADVAVNDNGMIVHLTSERADDQWLHALRNAAGTIDGVSVDTYGEHTSTFRFGPGSEHHIDKLAYDIAARSQPLRRPQTDADFAAAHIGVGSTVFVKDNGDGTHTGYSVDGARTGTFTPDREDWPLEGADVFNDFHPDKPVTPGSIDAQFGTPGWRPADERFDTNIEELLDLRNAQLKDVVNKPDAGPRSGVAVAAYTRRLADAIATADRPELVRAAGNAGIRQDSPDHTLRHVLHQMYVPCRSNDTRFNVRNDH